MERRSFLGAVAAPSVVGSQSKFKNASPTLDGVFIDLARALPAGDISPEPRKGHWRAIPWKGRNGGAGEISGTILWGGEETGPPPLTLDPMLAGPYELYVGLPAAMATSNANSIRIKLDNDPCYVPLRMDPGIPRPAIQDCPFRVADMTGRRIQIAAPDLLHTRSAAIAYIRATPVAKSRLDEKRARGMRMVALNDGFSYLFERGVCTEDRLWEDTLPYRDSPYAALHFCITGADHCNYPTKAGTLIGDGLEDYPRAGDRNYTECVREFLRRGIDPVASTMKFARSIGLEYHLSIRMEAFADSPPFDYMFRSKFFAAHPELRCVDLDGRRIARLSYAFPEVREHIYAIVDELAAYVPDGINLIFPRANPYVLYEEPFVAEFRKRHGTDPRKLAENHPDVTALRRDILNGFLREVRRRTRRAAAKPIEISAIVLSDQEANENSGLDALAWVRERLVEEISPSIWNAMHKDVDPQCGYLAQACRRSGCRLVPNLHPRRYGWPEYPQKIVQFLRQGAQGFSMWDLNFHFQSPGERKLMSEIASLKAGMDAPRIDLDPVLVLMTEMDGFVLDRYPAHWAF
ncbi:MAG: hypothetical protein M1541_02210 [Acidobacteria bacterium]|nr:hypothetical protein [Acidobacteriota bacterium]